MYIHSLGQKRKREIDIQGTRFQYIMSHSNNNYFVVCLVYWFHIFFIRYPNSILYLKFSLAYDKLIYISSCKKLNYIVTVYEQIKVLVIVSFSNFVSENLKRDKYFQYTVK